MTSKTSARDTKRSSRKSESNASSKKEEDELSHHTWNEGHMSAMSKGSGRVKFPRSQLEYFKDELKRLEDNAKKRNEQVKAPALKPYVPYIFNTLRPYMVTKDLRHAIDEPVSLRYTPVSRRTAGGPCDPWVSYDMDHNDIGTPRKGTPVGRKSANTTPRSGNQSARSTRRNEDEDKDGRRLPIYPIVTCSLNEEDGEFTKKDMYYNQVPKLREEVRNTYSANASKKMDEDYRRTKADFYRRRLDCMDEYTSDSRTTMRAAYFAYLTNTPGSARAVNECVKAEDKKQETVNTSDDETKFDEKESKKKDNGIKKKPTSKNKKRNEEENNSTESKENKPANENSLSREDKDDEIGENNSSNVKESKTDSKNESKSKIPAKETVTKQDSASPAKEAAKETSANVVEEEKTREVLNDESKDTNKKDQKGRKRVVLRRRKANLNDSNQKK